VNPRKFVVAQWLCLAVLLTSACAQNRSPERIAIPFDSTGDLRLSLLHLAPARSEAAGAVLFVHGATFPSSMAAGYAFNHYSWMDNLSDAGWDVWALDFLGYGESSRYPEMDQPANSNPALGRAPIAADQIRTAVRFILRQCKLTKLSLVAHSWGTIVAGLYATKFPGTVERLVLFGPVAQRSGNLAVEAPLPAWECVTERDQIDRFTHYVPKDAAQVFESSAMKLWAAQHMQTDTHNGERTPRCVRVPSGPGADVQDAWHGHLMYDPHRITAPTLIIRGEWDIVSKTEDALWLFKRLDSVPLKRDILISKATHVMHLESARYQLCSEVQNFLLGQDWGREAQVRRRTPPEHQRVLEMVGNMHTEPLNHRRQR
jgi:pimeloyl-ACP methyl ester carboxylesterase